MNEFEERQRLARERLMKSEYAKSDEVKIWEIFGEDESNGNIQEIPIIQSLGKAQGTYEQVVQYAIQLKGFLVGVVVETLSFLPQNMSRFLHRRRRSL